MSSEAIAPPRAGGSSSEWSGIETPSALVDALRARAPRVHCLTNLVAQNLTANVLLAAGAVPSMTIAPDEVADFAARSDALLVNIGTLDPLLREGAPIAIGSARRHGRPWVFDPVLVDRSDPRLAFARELLALRPAVIRCNTLEFAALAGTACDAEAVQAFAGSLGCIVIVSGAVDLAGDGRRLVRIANGHPLMARVTAIGCAATAMIAAYCASSADSLQAAVAALLHAEIAGEIAGASARGPGSFEPAFLDALAEVDSATLAARARLG